MATFNEYQSIHEPAPRRNTQSLPPPPSLPASGPPASGEIAGIDLRRLSALFHRRLRLFSLVAIPIFAIGVAFTLLSTPKYMATAQVVIDPRSAKVTKADDVLSPLSGDSDAVDTEVEVLKSRQLAEQVVDARRLTQDPRYNVRLRSHDGRFTWLQALRPTRGAPNPKGDVVRAVQKRLSVQRSGLTHVIAVSFTSEDPKEAAQTANAFANQYIRDQVDTKLRASHQASTWLNSRLDDLRSQVMAKEAAIQQYKIDNHLLSASGATLTEQEISNYNQTLAQADAQVAEDQARLNTARRQLSRGSSGDDVGETLNSLTIQKLKEQRAVAGARVAALQSQFRDAYPALRTARDELAEIDAQIAAETRRIISNLDAKSQVSRQRAAAIRGTLGAAQGQLGANNRASVALNELEREAQASRALYESYLSRYKETSSQEGLEKADARLVSAAAPPTSPSSPNVPMNLLVAAILAIGAGAGAAALAEAMENGLATSADVEKRFATRYLGSVPALKSVTRQTSLSPVDYVAAEPLSAFSEAFRNLLVAVGQQLDPGRSKVVAVTSALPREGKTTLSICLARVAALQGYKVVIVDCDLRRGGLQQALRIQPQEGLLEVLSGRAKLSQAITKDTATTLDILTATAASPSAQDLLSARSPDRVLAELRGLYDLVILDTPPVLPVADARILARKADFVLFVARWRSTAYLAIEGALRLLANGAAAKVDGIVLNQVDMQHQSRFGYGDSDYYFNEYKTYYLNSPSPGASS